MSFDNRLENVKAHLVKRVFLTFMEPALKGTRIVFLWSVLSKGENNEQQTCAMDALYSTNFRAVAALYLVLRNRSGGLSLDFVHWWCMAADSMLCQSLLLHFRAGKSVKTTLHRDRSQGHHSANSYFTCLGFLDSSLNGANPKTSRASR